MKRKQLRTPRQRALGRGLAALLLLGLWAMTGAYAPTVGSAVRDMEETVNCPRTRHILTMDPADTEGERVELWGNENTLLLGAFRWGLLRGWEARGFSPLDCAGEEPVHFQGLCFRRQGESLWYFAARVADPQGANLHLELGYGDDDNWVPERTLDLPTAGWVREEDGAYAVGRLPVDEAGMAHPDWCYVRVWLVDGSGQILWESKNISYTAA